MAIYKDPSFTDYEGFVEKFKPRKTTDDCYTPKAIYEALVSYIDREVTPLAGHEIVRPFYPGGDYEEYDYPDDCIVIDNPPFSIMSDILRFYNRHRIKFWLFAPGLTVAAKAAKDNTVVIINEGIIYENGANVATGFVTNIWPGNPAFVTAGDLNEVIYDLQNDVSRRAVVYEIPSNLTTAARLRAISVGGGEARVSEESSHVGAQH